MISHNAPNGYFDVASPENQEYNLFIIWKAFCHITMKLIIFILIYTELFQQWKSHSRFLKVYNGSTHIFTRYIIFSAKSICCFWCLVVWSCCQCLMWYRCMDGWGDYIVGADDTYIHKSYSRISLCIYVYMYLCTYTSQILCIIYKYALVGYDVYVFTCHTYVCVSVCT